MITIKTKLNDGIYKSSGGGQEITHYEYTTGPRNLLRAIRVFHEHVASTVRNYGNIGCGGSWLEIDGQVIHHYDIDDIATEDERDSVVYKSRTQKAKDLIAEVKSGEYNFNAYDVVLDEIA